MTDETLRAFIERREKALTSQILGLRGQIGAISDQIGVLQAELAEIERVKSSLPPKQEIGPDLSSASIGLTGNGSIHARASANLGMGLGLNVTARSAGAITKIDLGSIIDIYAGLTIKQLAIKALVDGFPSGGKLMEIRDFIRSAYGRTIEPSSLRPQLHRLKAAGILCQEPSTDTWNFQDGQRERYTKRNQPTQQTIEEFQSMQELQDEQVSEHEPVTRLRDII